MSALLDAALAVHPDPRAGSVGESWRDGTGVHPLAEAASGVFPPLELEVDAAARRASLETRFGPAWEGPPGLVHGGFVAAAFDMAMSALAAATCGPTVTRWLRVRYLKPTAIDAHLRFEVECDEPVGRLLSLRATLDVELSSAAAASKAPDAPAACPRVPLMEVTGGGRPSKARCNARASLRSLTVVPVPCALTWMTSPASIPASASASSMHSTAPSTEGLTRERASLVWPEPRISP